ncbi:MAG: hypothetical protein HQL72_14815 [Magnetococcales bacterium]|nr:hypothetical protein [Magnetococcales bacterium]
MTISQIKRGLLVEKKGGEVEESCHRMKSGYQVKPGAIHGLLSYSHYT